MNESDAAKLDWNDMPREAYAEAFFPKPKLNDILERCGSMRRMMEWYWKDLLTAAEEKEIEERVPVETRIGYKPIV